MNIDHSTIVVTGGAGLIGSATIDLLLTTCDPRQVIVFDDFSRGTTLNLEAALRDPSGPTGNAPTI